ncbi:hypothetical protein ACHAXA_000181, partial [Cyclostephanos tholiformis]
TASSIASSIDYRYFVAGGTCAAISHGITTPIDVVKTRMQSNPEKYRNILDTTAHIVKEEGASALVAGIGPTLVGYGIEGALKFGVYEVTKPLVVLAFRELGLSGGGTSTGGGRPGMLPFLLASIMAGAVASLVLVPMESTRIRMVTDPDFANAGLLDGLGRLVEESGLVKTLTVGMGAMLAKQIPYTFGKQVSFDVVAKFLYRNLNVPTSALSSLTKGLRPEYLKWVVSVLAAMVASVMACLLSQPGDVILTETYDGAGSHGHGHGGGGTNAPGGKQRAVGVGGVPKSKGLREVSSTIYNTDVVRGLSGFFTGLQARFLHVGLIITSQLVIYDLVKQLLGLPASGSH